MHLISIASSVTREPGKSSTQHRPEIRLIPLQIQAEPPPIVTAFDSGTTCLGTARESAAKSLKKWPHFACREFGEKC